MAKNSVGTVGGGDAQGAGMNDEAFARAATLRDIREVAGASGLEPDEVEPHGAHVAKVSLDVIDRLARRGLDVEVNKAARVVRIGGAEYPMRSTRSGKSRRGRPRRTAGQEKVGTDRFAANNSAAEGGAS